MRITIEIDDGKDVKVTKIEEREQEQPEGMEELTQEEAERFETASDIASYCEYLEENELMEKIAATNEVIQNMATSDDELIVTDNGERICARKIFATL